MIRPPRGWRGHAHAVLGAPPLLRNADAVCSAQARNSHGERVTIAVRGRFLGVVAHSLEVARCAAQQLIIDWPDEASAPAAAEPIIKSHTVARRGAAAAMLAAAELRVTRTYGWPGVDCGAVAMADVRADAATLWTATHPPTLTTDLALLLGLEPECVTMIAPGFEGADSAAARHPDAAATHHAAADAALLSQIAGRPVQVEYPPPPSIRTTVDGGMDAAGRLDAYAVAVHVDVDLAVGDSHTMVPAYGVSHLDVTYTVDPSRAALGELPNQRGAQVFAHESHVDEVAAALDCDPVQWRLRHLGDARGTALIRRTAAHAGWQFRRAPPPMPVTAASDTPARSGIKHGRGFAYASAGGGLDPVRRSWAAWVADVRVDTRSGAVTVTRVVLGHDADDARTPPESLSFESPDAHRASDAVRLLTTARRPVALSVAGRRDVWAPAYGGEGLGGEMGGELRRGEAALLPAAAAIANAIYDATGLRLREPPFSPERVRHALREYDDGRPPGLMSRAVGALRGAGAFVSVAAVSGIVGMVGIAAALVPWRAAIAPVSPPGPEYFSAAAIERGRLVAAAGDCAVCHTTTDGVRFAGGLGIDTPFGTVFSTNITPDVESGIGSWPYSAFERAMRSGIHRNGKHLYPAFPYTAYAKVTDGDLQALYAYLMSQTPVAAVTPRNRLAFPFNLRPLMAVWNLMFHRDGVYAANPAQSADWNHGAYLVEALGHCSGCHSPRNVLGAEQRGGAHLTGGWVDGWEAPALTAASAAPASWTRADFYDYLRTGYSSHHGAAAGPMADVVRELSALPDDDLRAMATYLAALSSATPRDVTSAPDARARTNAVALDALDALGERIYGGACAVCHEADQGPPTLGIKVPLEPTTTLHAASANNLIKVLLEGVRNPPYAALGYMPAFHDTLDDAQVARLAGYLRARFAPDEPPWRDVAGSVARIRSAGTAP